MNLAQRMIKPKLSLLGLVNQRITMSSCKHRNSYRHYLFCLILIITSFIFPYTCFSADLSKVKRFLLVSDLARTWDTSILKVALKSYTDALEKSGKLTQELLDKETINMEKTFKKHLSYNSIKSDLEECLTVSLQNNDVDFLIKYDLKLIQENADNESKFKKALEDVNMCIRSVVRIKLTKLKDEGQI